MGNSMIFPVPDCKYTENSLEPFYLPIPVVEEYYSSKKASAKTIKRIIPSLLIKASTKSKYLMIYLHGNSEDLGRMCPCLLEYYEHFQIDVLAPEYPGYGIYKGEVSVVRMIRDAQHVIDYATRADGLNYPSENIILVGRSLGTGVAVQLAARCPLLKGIVLISAFTSIRDIAHNVAGSLCKFIIPDIFQSSDIISEVKAPILFIHGKKDDLIPFSHSVKLYELCGSSKKRLELRELMDHNRCREEKDIFAPIEKFLIEELEIMNSACLQMKPKDLKERSSEEEQKPRAYSTLECSNVPMYQNIFTKNNNNQIPTQKDISSKPVALNDEKTLAFMKRKSNNIRFGCPIFKSPI